MVARTASALVLAYGPLYHAWVSSVYVCNYTQGTKSHTPYYNYNYLYISTTTYNYLELYRIGLQYISPNCYYVLSRISQSHRSPKIIFTRLEEKDQNNI